MNKQEIVQSALDLVETALEQGAGDALSLDKIAARMGYTKHYLNRVFRDQVGVTIHRYLVQRRMTEAARALALTDRPIIEIAAEAGYGSQQSFTHAFSDLYLCAPLAYRNRGVWFPLRVPHSALRVLEGRPENGAAA